MNLMKYWPAKDAVNDCIKPEAEGAHDAVLLAVHQPSPLSYRIENGPNVAATEDELYSYFTTPDVPMGVHVMPITGASGVGKSHMVRILAARLQADDLEGKYVVIRIPKSASLRTVVELILEPLPDERYANVKDEFAKAMTGVDIADATISFQGQLEIALKAMASELRLQAKANPSNSVLRQRLGHAEKLARFMGDPIVVEHFREQVFPRIVKRAIAGQDGSQQVDSVEDFTVADLELPESIELGKAAESTQSYYESVLLTNNRVGMKVAVDVLNGKVVDQAVRQLFKLHEAIGGMTLQDVILEIRRLLLIDNRELVILVEDFKALTGIQETLLNVLIQEGVRDNERKYATMRSAIAVTDGYLAGQDTIATRAKRQWVVESDLNSEEEVLQRTKRLVASYLNAARWGFEELVRRYKQRGPDWSSHRAWIEPFIDEETTDADLSAFGDIDGIPLFPFTELAIERLARSALLRAGTLVFTPRFVIDHVLRNLLLIGRDAYANQQFPPPSLLAPAPSAEVAEWLSTLPVSADHRQRYARLVTIWGDSPATRAELGRIPSQVYHAFGLESPGIPALPTRSTSVPKVTSADVRRSEAMNTGTDVIRTTTPVARPEDKLVADLRLTLENWVQNDVRLEQGVANVIRKALESAISDRIDWNAERCSSFALGANKISIPNAAGEITLSSDAIKIAPDHHDLDGRLRTELIALVRYYQFYKRKADYEDVDDDLARIANLVQRLMPQALATIRNLVKARAQLVTRLLSTNSRLLGVLERGQTPLGLSDFLFAEPKLPSALPVEVAQAFHDWRQLQQEALDIRMKLTDLLLDYSGCFQNDGRIAYGVDITRLLEGPPAEVDTMALESLGDIDSSFTNVLRQMRETTLNGRARRVLTEARRLQQILQDELGDTFDKNQVVYALKELVDSMAGHWSNEQMGMSSAAFKRLSEEFRDSALKEAQATLQLAEMQSNEDKVDGKGLSRIAQLDINPLIVAHRFVLTARKLVNVVKVRANTLHGATKEIDVEAAGNAIRSTFEDLLGDMDVLEAEGEQEC
ncbi:protein DpdH [Duganella fentianensis]|uniref:protein DpdH n=1 Tax=Duganella fentianensis TaxID=2692177 RepID=UPI0032B217CE